MEKIAIGVRFWAPFFMYFDWMCLGKVTISLEEIIKRL